MLLFNRGQLCLKELEAMHLAQFKNSPIFCRVLFEPYSVNKKSTNEHQPREESERVYRMRSKQNHPQFPGLNALNFLQRHFKKLLFKH